MNSQWLQYATLRLASFLVPRNQRADWLNGWRSELWYIPRQESARFCRGAFRDAIWVRRNSEQPATHSAFWFESPLTCLAFLAFAATVSAAIMACLPAPDIGGMLLFPAMFLLPALLTTGRGASSRRPAPWPNRLRRGIFLLLKFALVQPVILCGVVAMVWLRPAAGAALLLVQLANYALSFLTLRWVLLDQRNRCPVCLRLLTEPVRIGAPSQTFLEWYGRESACPCGHGLLQTSEVPSSYSAAPEWHRLDDSWSGLFSPAAEARQR